MHVNNCRGAQTRSPRAEDKWVGEFRIAKAPSRKFRAVGFWARKREAWDRAGRDPAAAAMMSTSAQGSLKVLHSFGSHRGASCSAPRCTRPSKLKGCRVRCRGEEEKLSDVHGLAGRLLCRSWPRCPQCRLPPNAMDAADNLSATTTYVPPAMDAGDGWAQFVVLMVTALRGWWMVSFGW